MTLLRRTLVVLLGVQVALSLLALATERLKVCDACRVSGFDPGMAGAVAYGAILVGVLMRGPTPFLYDGILFGAGVHATLIAQMGIQGRLCGICLAAAAVSAGLVGVAIAWDRANLGRLAIVAPGAALIAALGLSSGPPASPVAASGGCIGVRIYIQPDCPYCERLRKEIVPEIEKEFGTRVRIEYRSADDLPGIRRTPTLILDPRRAESRPRIIEGLPTLERLRGAIRDLEVSL